MRISDLPSLPPDSPVTGRYPRYVPPDIDDLPDDFLPGPIPTAASQGYPLPIVWGKARVTGRPILMAGAVETERNIYTLTPSGWTPAKGRCATVAFALCYAGTGQYEITALDRIWSSRSPTMPTHHLTSSKYLCGEETDFALQGTLTTTPWQCDPAYRVPEAWYGTAYVGATLLTLEDGKVPSMAFEVIGRCAGASGHAHPADVMVDLLTNFGPLTSSQVEVEYGPDGNTASSYRAYCTAYDFLVSRAVVEPTSIKTLVEDLLVATNSTAVWSDGKLKIVPLCDVALGGYTPPAVALELDDDEILREGYIVEASRVAETDTRNCWPVEIHSVDYDYESKPYEWIDDTDAARTVNGKRKGVRRSDSVTLDWVTRPEHALAISQLLAKRSLNVRKHFTLKVNGTRWSMFEPGDVIAITHAKLGLNQQRCRILTVEDDGKDRITLDLQEAPESVAQVDDVTPQTHDGFDTPAYAPDYPPMPYPEGYDADPGDSLAPQIAVVPYLYGHDSVHLAIATGGGAEWGGCGVYLSWDNAVYFWTADITTKATYGTLAATLPTGDQLDLVNSLSASLTSGVFTAQSTTDRDDLIRMVLVDNELLSWSTCEGAAPYVLGGLRRGAYGSGRPAHSAGAPVIELATAKIITIPASRLGSTLYVKLASFNTNNRAQQQVDTVAVHTFTPTEVQPPCPDSVDFGPEDIVDVAPGAVPGQYRETSAEGVPVIVTGDTPSTVKPKYAVISWTMEALFP